MNKYIETVSHLKKKLEKGVSYEKTLHILHKLQTIPVTIDLLHATEIGKFVRNLSKQHSDTDIGKTAKLMYLTWKAIIKEQQEQEIQLEAEQHFNGPEVKSKEEPVFDASFESNAGSDYRTNSHKSKRKVNGSDEEVNGYKDNSETDHSFKAKRKHNNHEESKSDKKHRKHKSSHRSREESKTEFEELNDQKKTKKKIPSNKRSETEKYSKDSEINSNEKHKKSLKKERLESNESKSHSTLIPKALNSNIKLKSLEHSDILSSLPTSDYKPLPNRELMDERIEANRRKTIRMTEDLSLNVQSKKGRTAVFAGQARSKTYTRVHKLEEMCIRVLMDNIDKLCRVWESRYSQTPPYFLLKPVLEKCNPNQLSKIEKYNPHLIDESDELWEDFAIKEFRGNAPREDENWKDMYYRCCQEREDRLKNITKNISNRQSQAMPVRKTKVSENVKTPREILRKQERNGISSSASTSSSGSYNLAVKIVPEKPKVAPLMKKALKLQKARYRR